MRSDPPSSTAIPLIGGSTAAASPTPAEEITVLENGADFLDLEPSSEARPFPLLKAAPLPLAVRIAVAAELAPQRSTPVPPVTALEDEPITNMMPSARRARDRARGQNPIARRGRVMAILALAAVGALVGVGLGHGRSVLMAHSAAAESAP
jgi:hypothetical protein